MTDEPGDHAAPADEPPAEPAPPTSEQPPTPPPAEPTGPTGDEALLPAVYNEDDLRDAVGLRASPAESTPHAPPSAPTRTRDVHRDDDDDDGLQPPRNRKTIAVAGVTLAVGLSIAVLVFLGHSNSQRYVITCESERVLAGQGRGFPPWGTHSLSGDEWKPISLPPEAECRPRETEDESELAGWYLDMLVDRASALLTAREVTKVDDASALLEQALLLARAPERRDQRKEIERLRGDVGYWRASAKLRDAATALGDAAKQFDAAAAQRPRHVSDASAWAAYVRKLADDLRAGPGGAPSIAFPPLPPLEHATAPPGVALPVEPAHGSGGAAPPPAAPADAGLPTGGVLL